MTSLQALEVQVSPEQKTSCRPHIPGGSFGQGNSVRHEVTRKGLKHLLHVWKTNSLLRFRGSSRETKGWRHIL